jgi:long-chain acyl-CoA synthetase
MTLSKILQRNSQQYPQHPALLYRDQIVTYSQLDEMVNRLANGLLNLGLEKRDRVAVLLPKTPEVIITFLAVARAGGVIFPVNHKLKSADLRTIFNYVSPHIVISEPTFSPLLEKLFLPQHPLSKIIFTGKKRKNGFSFDDILNKESSIDPNIDIKEDDVVYLNYTSGTTGIPKGALTTHANIIWNTIACIDAFSLTHNDVHLSMFPPYMHPHELFARGLYLGGTSVLVDSIFPKTVAREVTEKKVTSLMAVPYFFKSLFPLAKSQDYDFSSVRIPEGGGMHSPPEFVEKFQELFGKKFLPVWGSTETAGIAVATRPEHEYRPGSMGKACLNYDIRVVNSRAEEVPDGVDGEMVIKGPGVMQGYFNLPSETEAVLRQDWYHTGDIVRKDEDGFLFFLGRQSGMMKVGGMRVYPLEIVEAMTAHSMVEEVAIVSERDPMRGERPKAFVVLTEGSALSESELRGFLRSRLPDYKIPRKIDFLKELPKTAGGKIIKGELEKKSQSLTEDELEEEFEILAAIDRKLVELLNERAEATLKLIESIEPKKHSVFYPDYEERLLRLALEENKGPIFDESLEDIFEKIRSVIRML